jgi:hypothetical protein
MFAVCVCVHARAPAMCLFENIMVSEKSTEFYAFSCSLHFIIFTLYTGHHWYNNNFLKYRQIFYVIHFCMIFAVM